MVARAHGRGHSAHESRAVENGGHLVKECKIVGTVPRLFEVELLVERLAFRSEIGKDRDPPAQQGAALLVDDRVAGTIPATTC